MKSPRRYEHCFVVPLEVLVHLPSDTADRPELTEALEQQIRARVVQIVMVWDAYDVQDHIALDQRIQFVETTEVDDVD